MAAGRCVRQKCCVNSCTCYYPPAISATSSLLPTVTTHVHARSCVACGVHVHVTHAPAVVPPHVLRDVAKCARNAMQCMARYVATVAGQSMRARGCRALRRALRLGLVDRMRSTCRQYPYCCARVLCHVYGRGSSSSHARAGRQPATRRPCGWPRARRPAARGAARAPRRVARAAARRRAAAARTAACCGPAARPRT